MTPWQIDAIGFAKELNLTSQQAADVVILEWLAKGETKPLYDLVLRGHQPNATVLKAIAYMMMRGDPDCTVSEETTDTQLWKDMGFALGVRGKRKGRRTKAEIKTRDRLLAREVEKQMKAGVSYDGAIATVHEWSNGIGVGISIQTIRDAYDRRER